MRQELRHMERLNKRLFTLEQRIANPTKSDYQNEKAEVSALKWAIALAELAVSNWPNGISAVRDQLEQ